MAEFVLEKTDAEEMAFAVHNLNCATAKGKEDMLYLGSYSNALAAYNKAIGLHSGVGYCPDCLPG